MTALEEFQAKIQEGEIYDAMAIAMGEAIELKISTWIVSDENNSESASQSGYRMRTRINLIDGEIDNEIGRKFASNPAYNELQKLHLEQVTKGREILLNNLASLQSMLSALEATQKAIPEISAAETPALPETQTNSQEVL